MPKNPLASGSSPSSPRGNCRERSLDSSPVRTSPVPRESGVSGSFLLSSKLEAHDRIAGMSAVFPQVLIDLVIVGHVELDLETHFGLERLQHGEVPLPHLVVGNRVPHELHSSVENSFKHDRLFGQELRKARERLLRALDRAPCSRTTFSRSSVISKAIRPVSRVFARVDCLEGPRRYKLCAGPALWPVGHGSAPISQLTRKKFGQIIRKAAQICFPVSAPYYKT
jgi:hypothetical protein